MDKKIMINKRELVNEVLKLMLQFENKNISGTEKKDAVLKVLKNHYELTEDQVDLIDNFIDVIILFHKIHRTNNYKCCFKCF
jgi:metal-responsive CopG/Arc/MetJ family transcriptional regulator